LKFCKPLDESIVAPSLEVDKFHEGSIGMEYGEYGAEHKGVKYVARDAAMRGMGAQLGPHSGSKYSIASSEKGAIGEMRGLQMKIKFTYIASRLSRGVC
jgi:hypothetical protein